jgi:large subunit ribosomal protein L2
MGKNLTQQKRGKGSPTYKSVTFKAAGDVKLLRKESAVVLDLIPSSYHNAPLAVIEYNTGEMGLIIATEGLRVGQEFTIGNADNLSHGNAMFLKDIPEGVNICNVEGTPGDGGKFLRSSGATGKVFSKTKAGIRVQFKSKKFKVFNPNCLAIIGTAAGGGRTDKPFLKAGNKFKAMKSRNKYWPIVSAASMNAVDHPLGGARSSRKGRPTIVPKNAPAGRKVGMLRPRSTGRSKGKRK